MRDDHLTSELDSKRTRPCVASGGNRDTGSGRISTCYVKAPPVLAVMQDQISYLVSHAGSACAPGCADCARLEEAMRCLLGPFA